MRHGIAIFHDTSVLFFVNTQIFIRKFVIGFTLKIPFLIFHLTLFSGEISKLSDLFYFTFFYILVMLLMFSISQPR